MPCVIIHALSRSELITLLVDSIVGQVHEKVIVGILVAR